MVKVAILGYGTVGSGVAQVIDENKNEISKAIGDELSLEYILDLRSFPGDKNEKKVVNDIEIIFKDSDVKIICETMGGVNPAYNFTKAALEKGISVCTSNKELVERHGVELMEVAGSHGCRYMFEASVGGGIPIIRTLNTALAHEKITDIKGILNGTTNYILTKMDKDGADYDDVLREAQDRGYAERNPEADVEGHDSARKIAILSSIMTGKSVRYEDVYTEGITGIAAIDFKYAEALGKSIKLLGVSHVDAEGCLPMVAPFMIGEEDPLNGVNGVFNAILITANMLGDAMFYGRGAGKLATASAVVADVCDCAKNAAEAEPIWKKEKMILKDIKKSKRQFFVRVAITGRGKVMNVFGPVRSIDITDEEFGFITDVMTEEEFENKFNSIDSVISYIRLA